jgi:hypothetical protein
MMFEPVEPDDAQAAAVSAARAIEKNDVGLTWGIGNRGNRKPGTAAGSCWLVLVAAGSCWELLARAGSC